MKDILKWIAVIALVFVVGSNAFDNIYDILYPWNILTGALSSTILAWVSWVDKDKQYLMLNIVVGTLYYAGFIQEVLL